MKIVILMFVALLLSGCSKPETSSDTDEPVTVDLFRWDLEVSDSDEISHYIEDRFSLRFDVESPGWDEWSDLLSTRAAAGALPELFVGYGTMDGPTYQRWIREGLLLPLNDYIADYAHLNSYLERFSHHEVDGSHYAIPVEDVTDHVLMVRQDWLDTLDLEVPNNLEDLREVAIAMRDEFGVAPLSSSAPHTAGFFWLNAFFYAHGSRWSDWVWSDAEEQWIPSWITDGSKAAIQTLRGYYRDGLLDPDFLTNSDARKRELFANGEVGIVFHNTVDAYIDELAQREPDARIAIAPPPSGPEGHGMWGLDGYFSAIMFNADIQPEKRDATLSFLDFLHSEEGEELFHIGIEDIHYTDTSDGPKPTDDPLIESTPHAQLRTLRALEWKWTPPWDEYSTEIETAVEIGREYGVPPRFEHIVTESGADYEAQLLDLVYAAYSRMVTSERSLDTLWDDFVEEYLAGGGQEMIDEMNMHPQVLETEVEFRDSQ